MPTFVLPSCYWKFFKDNMYKNPGRVGFQKPEILGS